MKNIYLLLLILGLTSCVSKRKYSKLDKKHDLMKKNIQDVSFENEKLTVKYKKIKEKITEYNNKINALKQLNEDSKKDNDRKLDIVGDGVLISEEIKRKIAKGFNKIDKSKLENVKNLQDSINVMLSYNLNKLTKNDGNDVELNFNIDKTVVMISISDKMLFKTASHKVRKEALRVIKKVAEIVKSEPSMDIMIEGHTDAKPIHTRGIKDNWDLSVKRATAIVRILEQKFGIDSKRLIASGRGSSVPLKENNTSYNRAFNRRTRIIILPNLDKFFSLLIDSENIIIP
ncbi:flagellar motor protein MotB [Tenacibaculum sp. 190524A02b]